MDTVNLYNFLRLRSKDTQGNKLKKTHSLSETLVNKYQSHLANSYQVQHERQYMSDFFLVFVLSQKEISANIVAKILGDDWWATFFEHGYEKERCVRKVLELIEMHSELFHISDNGRLALNDELFRLYMLQRISPEYMASFNDKFIGLCEKAINGMMCENNTEMELYALEFMSAHYLIGSMYSNKKCLNMSYVEKLRKRAYDHSYWQNQYKASKSFNWSNHMLNEMFSWCVKFGTDEQILECALSRLELHRLEQNDATQVLRMVINGELDAVIIRIEQIKGKHTEALKRKFILYMLCLMELTLLNGREAPLRKDAILSLLKQMDKSLPRSYSKLDWSDFFPSYVMFQLFCEWEKLGLDYVSVLKRTAAWDTEWMEEKGPYSDLQLKTMVKCTAQMRNTPYKSVSQGRICSEFTKQGRFAEALGFAAEIKTPCHRFDAIKKISIGLSKKGRFAEALENAAKITMKSDKWNTLCEISFELAKLGKFEEAIVCAHVIRDKEWKSFAFVDVSSELAKKGMFKEADECAQHVLPSFKSLVNKHIITALTKKGLFGKALDLASEVDCTKSKINLLLVIVAELTSQGKIEECLPVITKALECARSLTSNTDRNEALQHISNELGRMNKVEDAISLLDEVLQCVSNIGNDLSTCRTLVRISSKLYKLGAHEKSAAVCMGAINYARGIKNMNASCAAHRTISSELAKHGLLEGALLSLKEALDCATGMSNGRYKRNCLESIIGELAAQAQASLDCSDILTFARNISDKQTKSLALSHISIVMAKQGKAKLALKSAREISNATLKMDTLRSLTVELANGNKMRETSLALQDMLRYDPSIYDDNERGLALHYLSGELESRGNSELAERVSLEAYAISAPDVLGRVPWRYVNKYKNRNLKPLRKQLPLLFNDAQNLQVYLNKLALEYLFIGCPQTGQVKRFNSTLNIQWAIDAKHRLRKNIP